MEPNSESPFDHGAQIAERAIFAQRRAEEEDLRADLHRKLCSIFVYEFSHDRTTPSELADAAITAFVSFVTEHAQKSFT